MAIDVQVQIIFKKKNSLIDWGMVTGVTLDVSHSIKQCLMRQIEAGSLPDLRRTLSPATTGFSLQVQKNGPPLITDDGNQEWLFSHYR